MGCCMLDLFILFNETFISESVENKVRGIKIPKIDTPESKKMLEDINNLVTMSIVGEIYYYGQKNFNNFSYIASVWYLKNLNQIMYNRHLLFCDAVYLKKPLEFIETVWVRFVNNTLFVFVVYISVIYACTYGVTSLNLSNNFSEVNSTIFSHLDEVEEECGQTEDLVTYFSYFLVCVLWFYLFNVFSGFMVMKGINWIILVFWFLFIMGVVIPTGVFKKMGGACAQFVRGSSRSTILIVESLLDLVSLTVIVLRFFLQNIRFIFIFFGFLEYYEFINSKLIYNSNFFSFFFLNYSDVLYGDNNIFFKVNYIFEFIIQALLYLYYVGHLTIVYLAQLSIYIALSFWIFFFFYFTFIISRCGNYFKYKRLKVIL